MKRSEFAQSIIEYCLVATLVAAGIILMGPFVIRAVNAHLKSWEDSVYDSVNDPLMQSPPEVSPLACDCSEVFRGACDGEGESMECDPDTKECTPKFVDCDRTQMFYVHKCNILNCDSTIAGCTPDPGCCTEWLLTGEDCGGAGCPPEKREFKRICGVTGEEKSCQVHASCSPFACIGIGADPENATLCPDDNIGLTANTDKSVVTYGSCSDGRKCEFECDPGKILDGGGGACVDPPSPPTKPPLTCRAIAREDDCGGGCGNGAYDCGTTGCSAGQGYNCNADEYELMQWCEGDCTKDDARVKICCTKNVEPVKCNINTAIYDKTPAGCGEGQSEVAYWCDGSNQDMAGHSSGGCADDDSKNRMCCNQDYKCIQRYDGNCPAGTYQMASWCQGNCDHDDVHVTLCCGKICGDGSCMWPEETCSTCPDDCGPCSVCGNGVCEGAGFTPQENCSSCADCICTCGKNGCELGESCAGCPADCSPCCGDGECTPDTGEESCTCPEDCPGYDFCSCYPDLCKEF